MKEKELKKLIKDNIQKLKPDLTFIDQELYIKVDNNTKNFIDIYATDQAKRHVLIEIKTSKTATREAIHEIIKYVENFKKAYGAKDSEIHVIIASTDWSELIIPFSRLVSEEIFSIEGLKINLNKEHTDFTTEKVEIIPSTNERVIAPWHNMYWYKDQKSMQKGLISIQNSYQTKHISDYILVVFQVNSNLTEEEKTFAIKSQIAKSVGLDSIETIQIPAIPPTYEYLIYAGSKLLTEQKYLKLLSLNTTTDKPLPKISQHPTNFTRMYELYEQLETIPPIPYTDYLELGNPAKFHELLTAKEFKLLKIIRNGVFQKNHLLTEQEILSSLIGTDGITGQKYKKTVSLQNHAAMKELQNELPIVLETNPVWKHHIFRILEEIKEQHPTATLDISIYNPTTGIYTIYHAATNGKKGILYIPMYYIVVKEKEAIKIYYGALKQEKSPLSLKKLLAKYYHNHLEELLLQKVQGGFDLRDTSIIEDLGLQYHSFCHPINTSSNFILKDNKWLPSPPVDNVTAFVKYLENNPILVKQIVTKIKAYDQENDITINSIPPKLAKYQKNHHQQQQLISPPSECNLCQWPLSEDKYLVYGQLKNTNRWAYMCSECFELHGEELTKGKGSLYIKEKNNWYLLAGNSSTTTNSTKIKN